MLAEIAADPAASVEDRAGPCANSGEWTASCAAKPTLSPPPWRKRPKVTKAAPPQLSRCAFIAKRANPPHRSPTLKRPHRLHARRRRDTADRERAQHISPSPPPNPRSARSTLPPPPRNSTESPKSRAARPRWLAPFFAGNGAARRGGRLRCVARLLLADRGRRAHRRSPATPAAFNPCSAPASPRTQAMPTRSR